MTAPDGGVTTYTHTDASELKTLQNPLGEKTTFTYDAAGRETLKELDNGTTAVMAYNAAGWQSSVLNLDSTSTTISHFRYSFDRTGQRTSVEEENGEYTNWTYDCRTQLNGDYRFDTLGWCRLTVEQWNGLSVDDWNALPLDAASASLDNQFVYDPAGNRTLKLDNGARTTSTYDQMKFLLRRLSRRDSAA